MKDEKEKPKKSDLKKPKEKKEAPVSSVSARSRYKSNQPGIHKKVRKILRASGPDAAKKFMDKHKDVLGLTNDFDKAFRRYNARKARKEARKNDPEIQKRLIENKIQDTNEQLRRVKDEMDLRRSLETSIAELAGVGAEAPLSVDLVNKLRSTDELRRAENILKSRISRAQKKLQKI